MNRDTLFMDWKIHHIKMSILFQFHIDAHQNCFKISARFFIDINKIILKFKWKAKDKKEHLKQF